MIEDKSLIVSAVIAIVLAMLVFLKFQKIKNKMEKIISQLIQTLERRTMMAAVVME